MKMTETATICAKRDERMDDHDMPTVQAIISNPRGKLPRGSLAEAQELVEDMNLALRNGRKRPVGKIVYEPKDDGDEIVELREL